MNNELDIRSLDFKEAWNVFKTEIEMNDKVYKEVRFGININFDVNDYFKGRILIKGKTGKALVKGRALQLEDFETELELRERSCKDWLVENFKEDTIATPRGIE